MPKPTLPPISTLCTLLEEQSFLNALRAVTAAKYDRPKMAGFLAAARNLPAY